MSRVPPQPDSAASWLRLLLALVLSTIGGVGMWSVVVALPAVQADFGSARAGASLPYTLAMIGFAVGGIGMGRLADRFGIAVPAGRMRWSDVGACVCVPTTIEARPSQ